MDYIFTIISPEDALLDKRMVYLQKRLDKKFTTFLCPSGQRDFEAFENGVYIFPFSLSAGTVFSLLNALPENSYTFGAGLCDEAKVLAHKKRICHTDILTDEQFCRDNAHITAEGALSLVISSTEMILRGMRIAVFGYGRIGSRLVTMLLSLGASVKVFTSNKEELSALKVRGIPYSHLWQRQDIGSFSCIVNTIPLHHVIPKDTLANLDKSTYILDLASGSNNVDWAGVKLLGLRGEHATSLPGKISPHSAAAVLENTIMKYLE